MHTHTCVFIYVYIYVCVCVKMVFRNHDLSTTSLNVLIATGLSVPSEKTELGNTHG